MTIAHIASIAITFLVVWTALAAIFGSALGAWMAGCDHGVDTSES